VRIARPALPVGRLALGALRRTAGFLRETILPAALVACLEFLGPHVPHDGADLIVLLGVALIGAFVATEARAGRLPGTRRLARAARRRLVAWVRRLQPRYAVAFRPTRNTEAQPDATLRAPAAVLAAAAVLLAALGDALFQGLLWVKVHASYTLYLAGLTSIWAVQAMAILGGGLAAAHWLQSRQRTRPGPPSGGLLLLLGAGWVLAIFALIALPGAVPLAALLLIAWWRDRRLRTVPVRTYLFCRRDARGRPLAIPVHDYLRRVHAAIVLALAVAIVLGQAQRLWIAAWPDGPFAFTTWLGLLATLCALLLAARAGAHFQRTMGGGEIPPEVPLTPTLWLRTPRDVPDAADAFATQDAWHRIAREHGWLVLRDNTPPEHEYDLVMGDPADPRRFDPPPIADGAEARFQLERRFHVVMRRRFHRAFRSLFKRLRAEKPSGGTGYLFCPHVWLVPGVVRDVEPGPQGKGSSGSIGGPAFHGPPYARAFPARVRRYIGGVLRDLQVDMVFFEDAIQWADLRRVLGVAFEIHDQGRAPLLERHFVGVPRVRVVLQEEAAEPEPSRSWLEGGSPGFEADSPGHARILVVLRDRGGEDEPIAPDPADTWIRTPSLVGG
jgi:hypothetical protein